jgi:hypothetical protein
MQLQLIGDTTLLRAQLLGSGWPPETAMPVLPGFAVIVPSGSILTQTLTWNLVWPVPNGGDVIIELPPPPNAGAVDQEGFELMRRYYAKGTVLIAGPNISQW